MGDDPVAEGVAGAADRPDPDAMWKPGYVAPVGGDAGADDSPREWFADYTGLAAGSRTAPAPEPAVAAGPPPLPAPLVAPPPVPRPDRGRRRIVAGVAGVAIVAAVAVVAVAVAGVTWRADRESDLEGDRFLASIPTAASADWSVELDTAKVYGVIGTTSTLVVLESVTNDLVGLSVVSGAERWRVGTAPSNSIVRLDHVAGSAVVRVEGNSGDRWIAAFDVESGQRRWQVDGNDRSQFTVFGGSIYRLPFGVTDVVVERLDPLTGVGLKSVGSQFVNVGWEHLATAANDRVEVLDLRTLERAAGPVEIGDVTAASAAGDRVVALGRDATLRLYSPTGDELASLPIEVDQPDLFDVTGAVEPILLVGEDHELVAYSLSGDRIVRAWRAAPVQINEVADVGGRTYAIVQSVVAAGPNGGPVRVLDVATGDVVAEPAGGNWVRLGRDGFVAEITDDEGLRLAVEGYGYDGTRRWRFDLAPDEQDLFLVEGAVVVVASDTADPTSTLTYVH